MQKSVFGSVRNWENTQFYFLGRGDRQFFSVRNREGVQKTEFFPSVTDNVCKNELSALACAKIGISWADVDVRNRGKNSRARRLRFAAVFLRVAVVCYLRRPLPDQFFYGSRKLRMRFFVPP